MPQTRMTDIQLNSASLTSLKNEVAAARGTSFTLKDYIDSKTNGLDDYRITGASYDAVNSVLNINVAPGRASIMDVLVEKSAATTVSVDSPSVATTFYVYLIYDGSFQVNTTGSVPVNGIYLGAVTTGAALSDSIVVGDHRPRLVRGAAGGSGSSSQELVDARSGYATLNDRLNSMAGASGSQTYQETFADLSHVDATASDATVDSRGVRIPKGTATVEDWSTNARVDTTTTDSTIVIDTAAKEARTNKNATQAVLQTDPIPTAGSNYVALAATETHETFFSPGVDVNTNISPGGYRYATLVDNAGRTWLFYLSASNVISVIIYNADGSTYKNVTVVLTCANGTNNYSIDNFRAVMGKDGKIYLVYIFMNANRYVYYRTFAADYSDVSNVSTYNSLAFGARTETCDWNSLSVAVDSLGRIWIGWAVTTSGANLTSYFYYGVMNTDGSMYRNWTTWPSIPAGYQPAVSLLPLSDGRMAVVHAVCNVVPARASQLQADYYIGIWNADTSLSVPPTLLVDKTWWMQQSFLDYIPQPALLESSPGKIQVFIQDAHGLFRVTYDANTGTVTRAAQSMSQDWAPYGLAGGTNQTASGRQYGYVVKPTRDLMLKMVGVYVQQSSTSASSEYVYVYRQDPYGMTQLVSPSSVSYAANQNGIVYTHISALLKAGQTYFICQQVDTVCGLHYGSATGGALQTFEWGTAQPAFRDTSATTNVPITTSYTYQMQFTFDTVNTYNLKLSRQQTSLSNVTMLYSPGDSQIALLYKHGYGDNWQNYSDYTQTWAMHVDPTTFTVLDDYKVEDVVQNSGIYGPVGARTNQGTYMVVSHRGTLHRWILSSTRTALTYQVSVDGGITWRAITGDGTPVNFTTAGTNLILRATFSSGRAKFTPHLKGYTLTEWPGTGAALTRTFISKSLPARNPSARANLATVQALNGGTIAWYVTNDGGNTWQQTVPGGSVNFNTWGGSDVRVKAVLSSPSAQNLSPVISSYTLVTGDTVAANLVEDRMRTREIEALKMMLEIDALKGASKNRLLVTVTDTFNDASGIDPGLSSGHVFDATNKLVYPQTYPGSVDASYDPASFTMSATLGTTGGGGIVKYGQSFLVGRNGSISSAKLKITSKTGNPGAIKLDLMDSGLTTVLASGTIQESQVLTDGSWTEILFSAPYAVTAGQTYVLMASLVTPAPANVYYALGGSNTSGYASGTAWYSNSTVSGGAYQQSTTNDIAFQTLMGGQPPCAIVVSTADTAAAAPSKIYLTAQELLNAGSITYYVSRDSGTTWTLAAKDALTDVSGAPSGTQVRVRAVITGDAQLLGWGWGWY